MTIPPVISNFPALNVFRSDRSGNAEVQSPQSSSSNPQDLVEISDAALEQLQGSQQLEADNEAQELASNTRSILGDSDLSLGLDPDFSA